MAPASIQHVFRECVEDLDRRRIRRYPRVIGGDFDTCVVDLTSNDYLGLSTHPLVRREIAKAALEYGTWRSSPVVSGYSVYHRQLEEALIKLKKTEECMLFSSGFSANVGVMTTLAKLGFCFFSDALNHASLIDGMRMLQANGRWVYRHNDLGHLEELLVAQRKKQANMAVVTDRLFSMDGDFCDLEGLLRLQGRFGFLLVVDEAHSTLVVDDSTWVPNEDVIRIGTLSKAVGQTGGFVCCTKVVRDALFNLARTFVYSTALSVPTVVGARVAIELGVGEEGARRRDWLWRVVRACAGTSPIIIRHVQDEEVLEAVRERLEGEGIRVGAIRPPTVVGCRVRMSVCCPGGAEVGVDTAVGWVRRVEEVSAECEVRHRAGKSRL